MSNIMDNIINVTTGKGSSTAFLIVGEYKTALMDCGMAYCASDLINNIRKVLDDGKKLDYIFISHSHYDHIGAIPYLRQAWPKVKVLAAEYAQNILTKESALKTMRELANKAAQSYGVNELIEYNDNLMKVDQKISEGDVVDLGGISITTIETPGHTKCSLSFLVNDEVMFASETIGCINKSGKIYTAFIISYKDAINSINKCKKANPSFIISPHFGLVSQGETLDYWQKCIKAANKTRDFIHKLFKAGYDEDKIYKEFKNAFYDEYIKATQPEKAFEINNRAMIKAIINEENK